MGRYKLFMSIGLSITLLVVMAVFFIARPEMSSVIWLMFSLIIILSLIGVAVNYRKLKSIEKRCHNLPQNYKEAYLDAQELIGLSAMTTLMKNESKEAILEIFEHAVLDNRALGEVINHDLKTFVKGFLVEGGGNNLTYLMTYSGMLFMGYLLLMKVYKITRVGFHMDNFKTETLDFGIVATYALIAFVFFPWLMLTMKKASSLQWKGLKRGLILLPFIIPIALFMTLVIADDHRLRMLLDQNMGIFNSPFKFLLGVLIFIVLIGLRYTAQNKKS